MNKEQYKLACQIARIEKGYAYENKSRLKALSQDSSYEKWIAMHNNDRRIASIALTRATELINSTQKPTTIMGELFRRFNKNRPLKAPKWDDATIQSLEFYLVTEGYQIVPGTRYYSYDMQFGLKA